MCLIKINTILRGFYSSKAKFLNRRVPGNTEAHRKLSWFSKHKSNYELFWYMKCVFFKAKDTKHMDSVSNSSLCYLIFWTGCEVLLNPLLSASLKIVYFSEILLNENCAVVKRITDIFIIFLFSHFMTIFFLVKI